MNRLRDMAELPPIYVLIGILVIFATTLLLRRSRRRRKVDWLLGLAREARMNFSPADRFDLTDRLRQLPEWAPQSTDLLVTDVLYAAHGNERRFVATASYQRSPDERVHTFVFRCVEQLPQNELDPMSITPAELGGATEATYRSVLAEFVPSVAPPTGA